MVKGLLQRAESELAAQKAKEQPPAAEPKPAAAETKTPAATEAKKPTAEEAKKPTAVE
jgi:hypothetical protein